MCVLTEESQIGKLAKDLVETVPNPMVKSHQAWLDGLTKAAKNKVAYKSAVGFYVKSKILFL
ncbi:hypothetical protein [Aggregatibacter kilianii]